MLGGGGAVLGHEYAVVSLNMYEQIKMARPSVCPEVAVCREASWDGWASSGR